MTIEHRDALATILDRIAEPGDTDAAVFRFDEVIGWPKDAITSLVSAKLLKEALPAETITCHGCEERCHRPIIWTEGLSGGPGKPTSTCHLLPDIGPFEHSTENLKRWTSGREPVAKFVGRAMSLQIRSHDARWRRIQFGALELDDTRRAFSIELDETAKARIGTFTAPLIDLIAWTPNDYRIDRDALGIWFAQSDDRQSGNKRYQPSTTVREDRQVSNQIKVRNLQRKIDLLAPKHPNLNKDQLAKKLTQTGEGEGMTAARIARVTRKPRKKLRRKDFT